MVSVVPKAHVLLLETLKIVKSANKNEEISRRNVKREGLPHNLVFIDTGYGTGSMP